ncbi:MAG: BatA domain-containing protein [Planctomycetota bacterium]|nr:BatA domain-containing protein [Planctomycetota bacterium]
MIEGFLNPGLAIGATLAAVPLVIHLLNRQRHRPQRWAAMRFVLAAHRKTRRRVQLENLLLLLLRMLAVAALAFAVARPFAAGDSPLAGLQEERRDLVLVIDGSASTGYRAEVESVFDRIQERAAALLEGLDEGRGDRVRVILAGARPRVFPWTDPKDARSILQSIEEPLDEALDLALALGEVANLAEESARRGVGGGAEIRLLSDLQESSFLALAVADEAAAGGARPALAEQLSRIDALDLQVLVEDLGPRDLTPPNLSVESILVLGEGPRAGSPFEVAVGVSNHGERELLAERVALQVGGERLPSLRVDVPARGTAEAVFTLTLDEPGYHDIVVSLEGDRLKVDDRRARVVLAPPPLEVLVVNGAPADRVEEDEAGYLLAVLEPPTDELDVDGVSGSPFRVRTISPTELEDADSPIEEADLIVLANVPALPRGAITRLEEQVAAGSGLLISVGDRIGDLAGWSENLFQEDGTGLLPGEPVRRVSAADRTRYYRVNEFDDQHPALTFFGDERWRPLLTETPFYDFVAFTPSPTARVLATFDDTARSPFLMERAYGDGKVVLWTSSVDRAWNRVPDSPGTFVPLVLELVQDLGSRFQQERNLSVGSGIELVVESFPRAASLISPSGAQRPIEGDSTERPDRRWSLPMLDGSWMESVGVYSVRAEGARAEPVAVQFDAREGDLKRATALEVEAIHPALRVATISNDDGAAAPAAAPKRGELWRWLALATLLFLVAESLWGAWIGSRRRYDS